MAAAKNISMACDRLGMIYKEGNLVTRNLEKAIEWLKLAAEELHYEMAQYHLAMCFFNGDGVKKTCRKLLNCLISPQGNIVLKRTIC